MSLVLKPDGYTGVANDSPQTALLWITQSGGATGTVTAGDWIAEYPTDTSNPAGVAGFSFRLADSDNADGTYGTCAVVAGTSGQTFTYPAGGGYISCYIRGIVDVCNVADAVATAGDLSIGSTAGRAIAYTGTNPDLRVIGRSLAAASSNNAQTEIYPHPRFTSL